MNWKYGIASSVVLLAGCGLIDPGNVTRGVPPNVENQKKFEKVDLVALLDPEQKMRRRVIQIGDLPGTKNESDAGLKNPGKDLVENAHQGFYMYPTDTLQRRRNSVQDRLLSASDTNCAAHLRDVQRFKGDIDFLSKAGTIILGGLGSIVSQAASQLYSAGAAASTGLGTSANDSYLNGLSLSVIDKGIRTRRSAILAEINTRQEQTIEKYTVERAIKDALDYHESCTVRAGLEEANTVLAEKALNAQKEVNETQKKTN